MRIYEEVPCKKHLSKQFPFGSMASSEKVKVKCIDIQFTSINIFGLLCVLFSVMEVRVYYYLCQRLLPIESTNCLKYSVPSFTKIILVFFLASLSLRDKLHNSTSNKYLSPNLLSNRRRI